MTIIALFMILASHSWAQDKSTLTNHDRFGQQNQSVAIRELQDGQFHNGIDVSGSSSAFTVNVDTFIVAGGIISAPAQPRFETNGAASFLIPFDNKWHALTFNTFKYHSGNLYNTTTGTTTVPIGGAGLYDVQCSGGFPADADGARIIRILKNNSPVAYTRVVSNSASYGTHMQTVDIVNMAEGDTVRCDYFQDSGSGMTLESYPYTKMVVSKRL